MRLLSALFAGCLAFSAQAGELAIGDTAPDFTLTDANGNQVKLSDYTGKRVVLEWFNPGCPYVMYAHQQGGLKTTAAERQDDVVWLAINSGAPGKQGHGAQVNAQAAVEWNLSHPILLDETGVVGKSYAAKTTPHMYLIDETGKLAYQGALDNAPLGKQPKTGYQHYVTTGIDRLKASQQPSPDQTKPYGCSVKYGS